VVFLGDANKAMGAALVVEVSLGAPFLVFLLVLLLLFLVLFLLLIFLILLALVLHSTRLQA
jgi:hypothetical protein